MSNQVFPHSIAFGSGKGGVGKTTTSVNYAIALVKEGYRVALLDLDPLSNVAALLDITLPESPSVMDRSVHLNEYSFTVFQNLDLLFYSRKLEEGSSNVLCERLKKDFKDDLSTKYDYLIFDLPAGVDSSDNLNFAVMAHTLVVVTNPEPTAHVAAGAYIKRLTELKPDIKIHIWHNRFSSVSTQHFDSQDVIGNYNRNMPEDERIEPDKIQLNHVGYIPSDPSLDLLHGIPSVTLQVHRSIENLLDLIIEEKIKQTLVHYGLKGKMQELLTYYIHSQIFNHADSEAYLAGYGVYLKDLLSDKLNIVSDAEVFTDSESIKLKKIFEAVIGNKLIRQLRLSLKVCRQNIQIMYDSQNTFMPVTSNTESKALEKELTKAMLLLSRERHPGVRNHAGVLIFYFSLLKLFRSKTLVALLHDFIPKVKDERGKIKRDRNTQIRYLVENTQEYRVKYLNLMKRLMPVVTKQINTVISVFSLQDLLLRNSRKEVAKDAYVRLLSNFFHDTIYSGLSVIIGFSYRSAAIEFEKAYKNLLGEHKRKEAA